MSSNRKGKARGPRTTYAPETKAAVIAALLTGQAVEAVAREYRLPVGTVKGWKSKMVNGENPVATTPAQKAEVGELLVEYLRENLTTLIVQQRTVFRDRKWLERQGAAELATLHGVAVDKVARLLQAMSGEPPEGAEAPPA